MAGGGQGPRTIR